MKKLAVSVMILFLAFLPAFYAASTGPALQISDYSTVPSVVYSGNSGQLKLNIANSGSDTATGISLYYGYGADPQNQYINIGDISASGSAITTIPFKIPENVNNGVLVIPIRLVYSDSTGALHKESPVSIPIQISQHQILEVRTLSLSKLAIQPGEKFIAQLDLLNSGGQMNNVIITTPDNSSFTLDGSSRQLIGDISSNKSHAASINLLSSSLALSGKYTIPIIISYQDALQNTITQTVYIGPITVSDSSTQFRIYLTPLTSTEIGANAEFVLTVENKGESASSLIVDFNQSSVFTPIGSSRIFFDYIGPKENATKTINLGINAASLAGYYEMPLTITANGKVYVQNIGITVQATSDIVLTSDTQPQFVTAGNTNGLNTIKVNAQIANVGNSPIRSVYLSTDQTKEFAILGSSDKFVGTLNVDDFTTFQFNINIRSQVQPGKYAIPIKISFKDSENQVHMVTKDITINVYSSDMSRLNDLAAGLQSKRGNNGLFGLGLIPTIIIAAVILIAGYFGYKKWKKGKNPNEAAK